MVFLILVSISLSSSTLVSDQTDWQIDSNVIKLTITYFCLFRNTYLKPLKGNRDYLSSKGRKINTIPILCKPTLLRNQMWRKNFGLNFLSFKFLIHYLAFSVISNSSILEITAGIWWVPIVIFDSALINNEETIHF